MFYLFSTTHSYISRLFLKWFGIVFFGFASIISLFEVIEVLRKLLNRPDVSLFVIVELILSKIPQHLTVLLPFLVLASVMMVLWRLNQSSELTVLRASGISIWQMIGGLVSVVICMGFFFITIINPIQATLTSRLYDLEDKLFGDQHAQVSLQDTGLWLKERHQDKDRIVHSLGVNMGELVFTNISFYEFGNSGHYKKRIMAKSAHLEEGHFILKDVDIYTEGEERSHHDSLSLETNITEEKIRDSNANPETMNIPQVIKLIDDLEESGLSSIAYRLYLYKQFAKVGLMIVMVFLATSFCLRPPRMGRTGGLVGLCLITGLIFHFFTDFVYALGLGGRIPPLVAVWSPVLIGGLISLALLIHGDEAKA